MQKNDEYDVDIEASVRKYADMVYRLAIVNTKSKAEAEDAFQEVFLKLLKHKQSIKSEEHLKAWLIRVTINQCKSMVMAVWNRRKVPLDTVMEVAEEKDNHDYSDVTQAVKELPRKYREVIHLYYYEELSIKEIAQVLNRNEATIKTQLARGRKLLNEKLKGEYHYDGTL